MKTGTQVALAVGTGYVLGRRRKMRLAMMVSGAAVAAGVGGIGGQLIRRGAKLIGSADLLGKVSPELSEIGGIIRHDLLDAGKGAARTAVNSRIDSLSDRLRDQADAWRNPADAGRGITGGGRDEQDEPAEDEDEPAEDETEEPANGARRRASGDRGTRRRASVPRDDEDADERPARGASRAARTAGTASPVRRTRR